MSESLPERRPLSPQETWEASAAACDPAELEAVERYLDGMSVGGGPEQRESTARSVRSATGPVALVETAFLASAASLIWLINAYFPPGPLLRIIFPLPIALIYLRRGSRAAWMGALVSGLLLAVLMGPPRSLLYLMPYAALGVQLGWMWRRGASWYASIALGTLLSSLGFFVRLWLLSLMLGEDLWVYLINQATQMINWGIERLIDFGLLGWASLSEPTPRLVQIVALIIVLVSSLVYLFTVHLASWLLLERLGEKMPAPPDWVQQILDS